MMSLHVNFGICSLHATYVPELTCKEVKSDMWGPDFISSFDVDTMCYSTYYVKADVRKEFLNIDFYKFYIGADERATHPPYVACF